MAPAKDKFTQLKELKELLDSGMLTQEEFDTQKKSILGGAPEIQPVMEPGVQMQLGKTTTTTPPALPLEMLRDHKELLVRQTLKGCMQELCGCEALNEFEIFPTKEAAKKSRDTQFMYSLEESSFCCRYLCKSSRSFTQTVWSGTKDAKGSVIMTMSKPLDCGVTPCCCILNPVMTFHDGSADFGKATLPCFLCLPGIKVYDAAGTLQYNVVQPSCCGGLCVNVCAEGFCNCKVPWYVYTPGETKEVGKIVKMSRGLKSVFSDAASFHVTYPEAADPTTKARLLGTTFLINMLFFESQKE